MPGRSDAGALAKFAASVRTETEIQNTRSEMPKLKNKSSAKKRFRLTAKGKVRFNSANLNHMLRRRSQKMKRTNRGTQILSKPDARIIKRNFLRNM